MFVWKSRRNTQAKVQQFHFSLGPSAPLPSRGFGPANSRGHIKDESNWDGGTLHIQGSEEKTQHWFAFLLFSLQIKVCEKTCPAVVRDLLTGQTGWRWAGAPGSPELAAGWDGSQTVPVAPLRSSGRAALHGTSQQLPWEAGRDHWASDARSSILHGKEPGQKVLL